MHDSIRFKIVQHSGIQAFSLCRFAQFSAWAVLHPLNLDSDSKRADLCQDVDDVEYDEDFEEADEEATPQRFHTAQFQLSRWPLFPCRV